MSKANTLIILDFETTGLSPDMGDRAIEIGAVKIVDGQVTDSFQELMNLGQWISGFIEDYSGEFACSMLAARRIYPNAPNHKLGTLVDYLNIPSDGAFHRALYDSQMTVKLWLAMLETIQQQHGIEPMPFKLLQKLAKTPKKSVSSLLSSWNDSN